MLARRYFLLLFALIPFSPLRGEPPGLPELDELFPVDNILVDVMALQYPPRMNELYVRLKAAMAANREWFDAYLSAHAHETPLPYDPKLGLSESEYREYLVLRSGTKLQKTKEVELKVRRTSAMVELRLDQNRDAIQPITIDLKRRTLTTTLVTLSRPEARDSKDPAGFLGPNQSYTWHGQSSSADGETLVTVSFTIGKITADNRKFIQYRVNKSVGDRTEIQFDTLWVF